MVTHVLFELLPQVVGKTIPLLLACVLLFKILGFGRREKHLPPGPPTLPVVGNAHLLPWTNLHHK
jgi:hypothetical protein